MKEIKHCFGSASGQPRPSQRRRPVRTAGLSRRSAPGLLPPRSGPSDNLLQAYLRRTGRVALLIREGEVEVAKRIEAASAELNDALLASPVAGTYLLKILSELQQGIVHAKRVFVPGRVPDPATLASVQRRLRRAERDRARARPGPVHAVSTAQKIERTRRKAEAELERVPTAEEIAERSGIALATIDALGVTTQPVASMETPLGLNTRLGDAIADSAGRPPHAGVEADAIRREAHRALASLSMREAKILRRRFGLDDGEERTLQECGEEFGITRERVRQIAMGAMEKLRERMGVEHIAVLLGEDP